MAALFGIGTFLSLLLLVAIIAILFVRGSSQCGSNSDDGGDGAIAGGAAGAWTQKGTIAYKTAKGIFDAWVKQGCSGAAAAGIVGYITGEGGDFSIPDRAEGHNGSGKDAEIAYGAVPSPVGAGYSVGGGGVYQLTPYTGFAPVGDKKWLDVGQQTAYFVKVKLPGWNPSMGVGIHPSSFREFAHLTDPVKACDAWNCAEIGYPGNMQMREANARKAYEMFGGANISANDSLIGGASDTGQVGASGDGATGDNKCSTSSGEEVSGKWGWPFKNIPKDGEPVADMPAQKFGHTGWFGRGGGDFHDGFDFGASRYNGDCLAVHDGKVHKIGNEIGWWYVWVKSDDGYSEVYQEGFTSRGDISVNEGDEVKVGDKIGHVTGDHTHLGITKKPITMAYQSGYSDDGTWLDPIKVIKQGIND